MKIACGGYVRSGKEDGKQMPATMPIDLRAGLERCLCAGGVGVGVGPVETSGLGRASENETVSPIGGGDGKVGGFKEPCWVARRMCQWRILSTGTKNGRSGADDDHPCSGYGVDCHVQVATNQGNEQ